MTEHTPGPWGASPPLEGRCQWNITAAGEYDPSKGAKRRIGFVGNTSSMSIHPEVEANAHLIAAAPALLEALEGEERLIQTCQRFLEDYLIPNGLSAEDTISNLIAALDGPEQREIQGASKAALALTRNTPEQGEEG